MKRNLRALKTSELLAQQRLIEKELARRENLTKANVKIQKILSEHGLSKSDLHSLPTDFDDAKNLPKTKALRKGYVVQPKYHDGEHKRFWAGRGKTPVWVRTLCETQKMTLQEFKTTEAYIIKAKQTTKE